MDKLEHGLYDDLANTLPSGVYRLRVYHDVSLIEDRWVGSNDIPYVVEYANDRFCEILQLDKSVYKRNPGVINDLIFETDKAEFARLNVEANLQKTPFVWEGRFLINGSIIWIQFKSTPRVLENQDIIWTRSQSGALPFEPREIDLKLCCDELVKLFRQYADDKNIAINI